jgi:CHAT domain-containing protein
MSSRLGLTAFDLYTQRYDLSKVSSVVLYYGGLTRQEEESDEPFFPIQRGFLTSGANQVATFLWKMDKESLGKVLNGIFSGFDSQGYISPDDILKAQSRLLKEPLTSHPYFWAGIPIFTLTAGL